jgi:hypothetical protein
MMVWMSGGGRVMDQCPMNTTSTFWANMLRILRENSMQPPRNTILVYSAGYIL